MKLKSKILCVIFLLLMISSFGYGQAFAPPAEEFYVTARLKFEDATVRPASVPQKLESRRYLVKSGGVYYYIFSDPLENKFQTETVMNFIKESKASASPVKINNLDGSRYEFATADGFYHRILIVKTSRRSYVFQATGEDKENKEFGHFLASVYFDEAGAVRNTFNDFEFDAKTRLGSRKNSDTDSTPTTDDNSVFATPLSPAAPQPASGSFIAPKLSSKPRANYNDYGRFYEIIGTVRMRVVFGADGKISEATPLTKLPFGLTEQAIIAARRIEFTPASIKNQPVAVTKIIEYMFSLF